MLYVLHGENSHALRNFIREAAKNDKTVISDLKASEITPAELISKYLSTDLFGNRVLLAVEVTKDKGFDFGELGKLLSEQRNTQNKLMFWSSYVLEKSHSLLKLPSGYKVEIKEFKTEAKQTIFSFLDAVFEKRKKDAYKELNRLLKQGEEEFEIFSMVFFGMRNLSFAAFGSEALNKVHPFIKGKAQSQARRFSKEKVSEIYDFLYHSDLNLKQGKISLNVLLPLVIEKITS